MAKKKTFYIIWSPEGRTPPRVIHQFRYIAERIANDMAMRYPDQAFFVMKAKSEICNRTVVSYELKRKYFGKWRPRPLIGMEAAIAAIGTKERIYG